MWQLAHLASGALVGQQVQNPALAFGLGVGAHLLIDKIPHYWPKASSQKLWFTVIDYVVTLPCAYLLITNYHTNTSGIIWGVAGGLIVDILLVGIPAIHKSKLGKWHYVRQPHRANPLYLLTDGAVIAISLILLQK